MSPSNRTLPLTVKILAVSGVLCVGGLVAAVVAVAPTTWVTYTSSGSTPQQTFAPRNLLYFPVAALITIPSSVIAGLPLFFLLQRLKMVNYLAVSVCGIIAAITIGMLLKQTGTATPQELLFFSCLGLTSSTM